jgi:O-succinylbenzoic acid--CoA ligase
LVLWRCAVARAHVLLAADGRAESLAAALEHHRPTIVSLVPTLLARLLDLGVHPRALQTVLVGGASCDPQLLIRARQAGWPVRATYGMTETCAQLATASASEPLQERHGLRRVGPILPGMAARVIGDGPEGEIAVSGPQLFSGYLGQVDTAVELVNGELWFRTGDHGSIGDDGALWVASRRLDRLIRGGENIDPLELEAVLLQVPGVVDAAVAGVADALWGDQVGAWLVVSDADSFAIESCSVALAQLAPFKRPTRWRIGAAPLPRNSLGKLLRSAVRDALQDQGG